MHYMHGTVTCMATHDVHTAPRDATTLTPAETMRALGISRSTLNRYVDGDPPRLRAMRLPSGHRRFAASDVEALLAGEPWDPAS